MDIAVPVVVATARDNPPTARHRDSADPRLRLSAPGPRAHDFLPGFRPRAIRPRGGLPPSGHAPGYDRLVAADTGEIWARRSMLPRGATAHWDVFQPDGRYLGRVDVPAALRLHGVSDGQLLGVHEDELGVQRVQAWNLRREH